MLKPQSGSAERQTPPPGARLCRTDLYVVLSGAAVAVTDLGLRRLNPGQGTFSIKRMRRR